MVDNSQIIQKKTMDLRNVPEIGKNTALTLFPKGIVWKVELIMTKKLNSGNLGN